MKQKVILSLAEVCQLQFIMSSNGYNHVELEQEYQQVAYETKVYHHDWGAHGWFRNHHNHQPPIRLSIDDNLA